MLTFTRFLYKAEYMMQPQIRILRAFTTRAYTNKLAPSVTELGPDARNDSHYTSRNSWVGGPRGISTTETYLNFTYMNIGPLQPFLQVSSAEEVMDEQLEALTGNHLASVEGFSITGQSSGLETDSSTPFRIMLRMQPRETVFEDIWKKLSPHEE
jgi:hypothetical protein